MRGDDQTAQQQSSKTAKELIAAVLEPGEKILWSAKPDTSAELEIARNRSTIPWPVMLLLAAALCAFFIGRYLNINSPGGYLELARTAWGEQPVAVIAIGLILTLMLTLGRKPRLRYGGLSRNYLKKYSYGITDRRLLILSDGEIIEQFRPDDVRNLSVKRRGDNHGDVVLRFDSSIGTRRGFVDSYVGFESIDDPDAMRVRLERWVRDRRRDAEQEVRDFASGDEAGNQKVIRLAGHGIEVTVPGVWDTKVRHRRKPYGKVFLDFEKWKAPDSSDKWNVMRTTGSSHESVEVHIDRTKPIFDFHKMLGSGVDKSVAGEVVESEEGLTLGSYRGFQITRREHVAEGTDQSTSTDRAVLRRATIYHDGERQLAIVSTWPDGSAALKRAVQKVVDSIQL